MAEQAGMGILAEGPGSDLLLSSVFPQGTNPTNSGRSRFSKRVKISDDGLESSPTPSHACHICQRVYERADHLNRHMRSHENTRPYQCTRCPKRFNRGDLLARHENIHERDADGNRLTMIPRTDRASEACLNCAAAKAKCDDQKPCGRCRVKNVPCHTAKHIQHHPIEDTQHVRTDSDEPSVFSQTSGFMVQPSVSGTDEASPIVDGYSLNSEIHAADVFNLTNPVDQTMDLSSYFNPVHNFFQDMNFNYWDLNCDEFVIPQLLADVLSPPSAGTSRPTASSQALSRDLSKGHAAFRRSPWIWEPEQGDHVAKEKAGLAVKEPALVSSRAFEKSGYRLSPKHRLTIGVRDRLFALVTTDSRNPLRSPSFPSLDLLNYVLEAYLVHEAHQCDSLIHMPTFNANDALPELVASAICSGATLISVPSIWKFGYALQEILRWHMVRVFENDNRNTRNLACIQSTIIQIDCGLWSGFKRKTELAEICLLPTVTMIRRAGILSGPPDSMADIPSLSDSPEALEAKWHAFIKRESYKHLVLHIFLHDVQASISLQKPGLMTFTEINFTLPAARDLWKAPSAESWRDAYLRKSPLPPGLEIPRLQQALHNFGDIEALAGFVDSELCYTTILHGFWSQVSSYRDAMRFYQDMPTGQRHNPQRLWLNGQYQELYRCLSDFRSIINTSTHGAVNQLSIVAELLLMALHVSTDDLQRYAGKAGVEEARLMATTLEGWINTPDARYAAWHAGQVLRSARRLPPTSLRRFNAVAVYYASLTLWVYGLLSSPAPSGFGAQPISSGYVFLDGMETHDTRAFLQLNHGVPAVTLKGDPASGVAPLSDSGVVLSVATIIFRDNFPVRNEPLPNLVEKLGTLLRDLGTMGTSTS